MNERLPVISLYQPWAQWISLGWKTIETRTHKRFACLKGKRIGIHAGLKWDDSAIDVAGEYLERQRSEATRGFLKAGGAIICTAFVSDFRVLGCLDSEYALIDCTQVTRYGLVLREIEPTVIPCKGGQGIFYFADAQRRGVQLR